VGIYKYTHTISKRLQILLPDDELRLQRRVARQRKRSVSSLAREGIQLVMAQTESLSAEERLSRILRFSRFAAPTADIETMLREIEAGRE
jgi:hypothetical protein